MKVAYLVIAGLLVLGLPVGAASNWKNLKADETGTPDRAWKGGNGLFEIQGVLGGATVNLQRKLAPVGDFQDVTPITTRDGAADCDLTADGEFCWFVAPGDSQIHPVVVGGDGTTDITVMVSGADQASVGGGATIATTDNAVQFGNLAGDGLDEDPTRFFYDGSLNIGGVASPTAEDFSVLSTAASGAMVSLTNPGASASWVLDFNGVFNHDIADGATGEIWEVSRTSEQRIVYNPGSLIFALDSAGRNGIASFLIQHANGHGASLLIQNAGSSNKMELLYDDSDTSYHISVPGNVGTDAVTIDSSGLVSHSQSIGASPPSECEPGATWIDTDETVDTNCTTTNDNSLCCCIAADTWVVCGN